MSDSLDFLKEFDRSHTPTIKKMIQGNKTYIMNWAEIIKELNADKTRKKHLKKYLAKEAATRVKEEHPKLVFSAKVTNLESILDDYFETYILCDACNKPDTVLKKEKKKYLLRCEACGNIEFVKNF